LGANAAFLAVEVVGGFAFGSLALLADAVHMVSDVIGLAIAYAALQLARRPPTERHTYGFGRTEVLVAHALDAGGVVVVGGVGLLVNIASAAVVARHAHGSLSLRGALWHLLADALGSVAVIVAGVGVALFGTDRLDPIASMAIAVLVIVGAWKLLRDSTRVLLESVPAGLDAVAVTDALCAEPGVEAVHHLHLWTSGSEHAALSAHVVLGETPSLHDAQLRAEELKRMLVDRFGILHATLEVECHECADDATHSHLHHL
jgi:cobalt-zinc-cadmium efflux system protein